MMNAYEVKFRNVTEREMEWDKFVKMRSNMKVISEVAPYYFTWLLLTLFRVDRGISLNVLLGLIFTTTIFEI